MKHIYIFLLWSCFSIGLTAQPGTVDSSFNNTGRLQINTGSDDYFCYPAQQADGKILIAGTTYNGSNNDITLIRLQQSGLVDSSFGSNGKKTYIFNNSSTDNCRAILIQPDGKILLAGNTNATGGTDFFCMRLDTAGNLDTSFNSSGKISIDFWGQSNIDLLYGMTLQSDGKILLCGYSSYGASALRYGSVVRLKANGTLDGSFNGSGKSGFGGQGGNDLEFYGINTQADGKILVTGKSPYGATRYICIYRLTSSGGYDNTFNSNGTKYISYNSIDYGTSITQQPDKKILVSGYAQNYGQFFTLRLDSSGGNDNSWNSNGVIRTSIGSYASILTTHALLSNGKVLEAGHAVNTGGGSKYQFALSRKKSDGTPDSTFNSNGKAMATVQSSYDFISYGLAVLQDGRYLVTGYQNNGSKNQFTLMMFKGDTAPPTFTFADKTVTYGDTGIYMTAASNSSSTKKYRIVSGTAATIDSLTGKMNILAAGSITVMVSQTSSSSYTAGSKTVTLTISPAVLNISIANTSREYGNSNPTLTATVTGLKYNDSISVASFASNTSASTNTGSYTNVTYPTAYNDPGNKINNYTMIIDSGDLQVTKATLTAKANDQSRGYGANNPVLGITYTGFKNGETVAVINTLPTVSGAPAVTDSVGVYTLTASNGADDNYIFSYTSGTFTITKAILTIKADDKNRDYGSGNPSLTIGYSGFMNGEDSSVLDTLPFVSGAPLVTDDAGTYTLTPSGGSDNNYTLSIVTGTFTINKISLSVSVDSTGRIYGNTNPTFTLTYSGFANGDDTSAIDILPAVTAGPSVTAHSGSYTLSVSGASDNNYTFNYISGTLTIIPALLQAKADNQSRVYGANNPALTITYIGFKNGETAAVIDTLPVVSGAPSSTDAPGNYNLTVSGGFDGDYNFNDTSGTFTITKATLTATADNKSRSYGAANPSLTITYIGFQNGENESVLDTLPVISGAPQLADSVNTYTLSISGGIDDHYNFSYTNGTFSITQATLTVKADNQSRVYGASNPALSMTYSGFQNGENITFINVLPAVSGSPTVSSHAGNYTIIPSGGGDHNYSFTYDTGIFTITKALLNVATNNQTRIYGASNPSLTITYTGFVNNDTVSDLDTLPQVNGSPSSMASVNIYTLTASGGSDNDYDFTYVNGNFTISKAPLDVTADNQSRIYGAANPGLTFTFIGFVNNENSSVIDTLPLISGAPAITAHTGNYTLSVSGGDDNNYYFVYHTGTFNITKANLSATPTKQTRIYGSANPSLTLIYSGFVNGDQISGLDTLPTVSGAPVVTDHAGIYILSASGGSDNDYQFTYNTDTFLVTKATLLASVGNSSRPYATANLVFNIIYTGFLNGDNNSVIDVPPTASTSAGIASNTGVYTVTVSGGSDNDYNFSYVNGQLTITKIAPTLTFTSVDTGMEGAAINITTSSNSSGNITYTLTNGSGLATLNGNVLSLMKGGIITIQANQTGDTNYIQTTAQQTITIHKIFNSISVVPAISINMYPNPSQGDLNIESSIPVSVSIYDAGGKMIFSKTASINHRFALNEPPGLYLVRLNYQGGFEVRKLVVE